MNGQTFFNPPILIIRAVNYARNSPDGRNERMDGFNPFILIIRAVNYARNSPDGRNERMDVF